MWASEVVARAGTRLWLCVCLYLAAAVGVELAGVAADVLVAGVLEAAAEPLLAGFACGTDRGGGCVWRSWLLG